MWRRIENGSHKPEHPFHLFLWIALLACALFCLQISEWILYKTFFLLYPCLYVWSGVKWVRFCKLLLGWCMSAWDAYDSWYFFFLHSLDWWQSGISSLLSIYHFPGRRAKKKEGCLFSRRGKSVKTGERNCRKLLPQMGLMLHPFLFISLSSSSSSTSYHRPFLCIHHVCFRS